jgi:hypothetical protein
VCGRQCDDGYYLWVCLALFESKAQKLTRDVTWRFFCFCTRYQHLNSSYFGVFGVLIKTAAGVFTVQYRLLLILHSTINCMVTYSISVAVVVLIPPTPKKRTQRRRRTTTTQFCFRFPHRLSSWFELFLLSLIWHLTENQRHLTENQRHYNK